jgi:hypothetical protein
MAWAVSPRAQRRGGKGQRHVATRRLSQLVPFRLVLDTTGWMKR